MAVTDTLSIILPATMRHEKIYLACVTATYPRYLVSSTRLSLRRGSRLPATSHEALQQEDQPCTKLCNYLETQQAVRGRC
jgi:hypothetical protein